MVRQLVYALLDGPVNDREMESRTGSEEQRKSVGNHRGNVNTTQFHEATPFRGWTEQIAPSSVQQIGFERRSILGPDLDANLAERALVLIEATLKLVNHVQLLQMAQLLQYANGRRLDRVDM